jgi:cardiolipin synthase
VVYRSNEVSLLQDDNIFETMLDDIDAAHGAVHLETFVWSDGVLVQRLVERLCAAVTRGVTVRLLIDAVVASAANSERLQKLRDGGVELAVYRPIRPWNILKMNHRTHRKLLIVDGTIGYCFGHGMADQWYKPSDGSCCWRDTGVRIRGPAVNGLQQVFFQNWMETTHCAPLDTSAFPANNEMGNADVHVVSSAPGDSFSDVALIFLLVMKAARKEILMQNPYFVPEKDLVACMAEAVSRGVRVRLMLPGEKTDSPTVTRAGRHLYQDLVEAGVELYEYQRTLCHQKIAIVDDFWSHVGSTNLDARSLELNAEVSVGIASPDIAAELKEAFAKDLEHCRRIESSDLAAMPQHQRWLNALAYQLHDQL